MTEILQMLQIVYDEQLMSICKVFEWNNGFKDGC